MEGRARNLPLSALPPEWGSRLEVLRATAVKELGWKQDGMKGLENSWEVFTDRTSSTEWVPPTKKAGSALVALPA